MLLWATHVTEEHYPQLEKIKSTGFDGVEIPMFAGDDGHYRKLRIKLDELQLRTSTVTVCPPEASAIRNTPALQLDGKAKNANGSQAVAGSGPMKRNTG